MLDGVLVPLHQVRVFGPPYGGNLHFLRTSAKTIIPHRSAGAPTVPESRTEEAIISGVRFCLVSVSYLGRKINKDCSKVFFDRLTGTTWKTRGYGRYYYFIKGEFKGCFDKYVDALTGN
jgi:hypothetical protein